MMQNQRAYVGDSTWRNTLTSLPMHAPLCTGLLLAAPNPSNAIGPGEVAPCRIPCLPDAFHTKCNGCHKVPRPPYRMPPLPPRIPRPTHKEYHACNTEYNAGYTGHRARHINYNACNAKRHARQLGWYITASLCHTGYHTCHTK